MHPRIDLNYVFSFPKLSSFQTPSTHLFDGSSIFLHEKRLSSDDSKYRKDDYGKEILYAIDEINLLVKVSVHM